MASNDIHVDLLETFQGLAEEFNKYFGDKYRHFDFRLEYNPLTDSDDLHFHIEYHGNMLDDYLAEQTGINPDYYVTDADRPHVEKLEIASKAYWEQYHERLRGWCYAAGFDTNLLDWEWASDESPAFVTVWIKQQ